MTKALLGLALALAACSIAPKHSHGGDDDATGDGGTSSDGSGSAATTIVELSVLSTSFDGLPDTGAIAVFRDPGGAVIGDGLVDSAGHARADMPNGGTVTVIRISDQRATERDVATGRISSTRSRTSGCSSTCRSSDGSRATRCFCSVPAIAVRACRTDRQVGSSDDPPRLARRARRLSASRTGGRTGGR